MIGQCQSPIAHVLMKPIPMQHIHTTVHTSDYAPSLMPSHIPFNGYKMPLYVDCFTSHLLPLQVLPAPDDGRCVVWLQHIQAGHVERA